MKTDHYEVVKLDYKLGVRLYTSNDPGSYVPPHWYDALELVLMQKGKLTYTTGESEVNLKSGDLIVSDIDVVHATYCAQPNRAIVLQIPYDLLIKVIPNLGELSFKTPTDKVILERLNNILQKMQQCIDEPYEGSFIKVKEYLYELIFVLYTKCSFSIMASVRQQQNKEKTKIKDALSFIRQNYTRLISLEELSELCMMQKNYFCRVFKQSMGITCLEYINEIRLSMIYQDLISTNDTLADILDRHGFTNFKLFSRMFKERFKMTAHAYRQNYKKLKEGNMA